MNSGLACVLFPLISCVSSPFNDDLGTPPTRRPHSWKKNCRQQLLAFLRTYNAFRSCKLLSSVTAPGCREFGCKAFEECCSLQSVYTLMELPTSLATPPSLGITSFEAASTLLNLPCERVPSELPSQSTASDLALGCLSSAGTTTLTLTQGFAVIGAHACDNCHLLKKVDLSTTQIEEIQEFTFVHCTSLKKFVSR